MTHRRRINQRVLVSHPSFTFFWGESCDDGDDKRYKYIGIRSVVLYPANCGSVCWSSFGVFVLKLSILRLQYVRNECILA